MNLGRIVVAAAAACALGWTALLVYESTRTDEERIRAVVGSQASAFNDGSVRGLDGFHVDFRDRSSRMRRPDLLAALLHVFQSQTDRTSGRLKLRIEIPEDAIEVTAVDGAEGTAQVEFEARLHRGLGEDESYVWGADIEADFVRDPREGWQFAKSRYRTTHGRVPRF